MGGRHPSPFEYISSRLGVYQTQESVGKELPGLADFGLSLKTRPGGGENARYQQLAEAGGRATASRTGASRAALHAGGQPCRIGPTEETPRLCAGGGAGGPGKGRGGPGAAAGRSRRVREGAAGRSPRPVQPRPTRLSVPSATSRCHVRRARPAETARRPVAASGRPRELAATTWAARGRAAGGAGGHAHLSPTSAALGPRAPRTRPRAGPALQLALPLTSL